MTMALQKSKNFTTGKLFSAIIIFILPIIATNILQTFYNVADMIVVGLSNEPDSVGAIGTVGAFCNLILQLCVGFSVGVNAVVAFFIGNGDDKKTSQAVHSGILLSFFVGVFCSVLGISITKPIVTLLGNKGKVFDLAVTYCYVYFLGAPFIALTNSLSGVFRAKGKSKIPLIVLSISGAINVGLNLFFVCCCNMSVDGVALATVISNAFSAVLLMVVLSKETDACKFRWKSLKFEKDSSIRIIKIGIPSALQGVVFSLSNMIIQSSIISINNSVVSEFDAYQPIVKANAVGASLEMFSYGVANSVHQAAVTFVGQNYGAKKFDRLKIVARDCYIIGIMLSCIAAGILLLLMKPLAGIYGLFDGTEGSLDNIAYNAYKTRMIIMISPYLVLAIMDTGSGLVRGFGYSLLSTIVSFFGSCVLRIIWIYTAFPYFFTLESIYITYPVTWLLTGVAHFICFVVIWKKLKRKNQLEKDK